MDGTRKCPYCAEEIRAEALRCPYCRSRVAALDPTRWYRDHEERRAAGVAAAISHALAFPLTGVRVAFVILTFIHFLGPMVYAALWLVVPFAPGGPSPFERALAIVRGWIDGLMAPPRRPGSGPTTQARNGEHRDDFEIVSGGPLA